SQENLVKATKLAVVGEMAAAMAHEIRTPLGILRSAGQLLSRQNELADDSRELIGFILSESDRLNRLVNSLLDCAKPRAPVFRLANISDIADAAVKLL